MAPDQGPTATVAWKATWELLKEIKDMRPGKTLRGLQIQSDR